MNDAVFCKSCRKPKAPYACGVCQEHVCKGCAQFLTETFSFRKSVPDILKHSVYCTPCFDENVAEPLSAYNDIMERAKEVILYSKGQSKLTRLIKRKQEYYTVENCEDEEEAAMRMSFRAAEENYNCLIDLEYNTKKAIVGSHKKTIFSARAMPCTIDPNEIRGHLDPP